MNVLAKTNAPEHEEQRFEPSSVVGPVMGYAAAATLSISALLAPGISLVAAPPSLYRATYYRANVSQSGLDGFLQQVDNAQRAAAVGRVVRPSVKDDDYAVYVDAADALTEPEASWERVTLGPIVDVAEVQFVYEADDFEVWDLS